MNNNNRYFKEGEMDKLSREEITTMFYGFESFARLKFTALALCAENAKLKEGIDKLREKWEVKLILLNNQFSFIGSTLTLKECIHDLAAITEVEK